MAGAVADARLRRPVPPQVLQDEVPRRPLQQRLQEEQQPLQRQGEQAADAVPQVEEADHR